MKKHFILSSALLAAALAAAAPAPAVEVVDLAQPESVTVDAKTGAYFVSNMNGAPAEKDNNGFISKISPDGLVTVLKFIESKGKNFELHAPKGLKALEGVLYAVDIDGVKAFDTESGAFIRFYDFGPFSPGFLNDIAADRAGNLFVSDMTTDRIFKLDPKAAEGGITLYKKNRILGQPNGLLVNEQTHGLMVVSWAAGRLMEIDANGHVKILRKDLGALDGLTADVHGNLYISNYTKGEIYFIPKWGRGHLALVQSGLASPADIFYDDSRDELLVPLMSQNRVTSIKETVHTAA